MKTSELYLRIVACTFLGSLSGCLGRYHIQADIEGDNSLTVEEGEVDESKRDVEANP